ncbi:diaminohydroxyphosphoribosylaminopyrimidine deaminase [Kribbella orskensis]|uniref:diaminohydroxyphosphoribosylaminopyrimidine deaminase n=2 Tax=Kribbellaceae TaxID=2726069 RepID=A0ABY2B7H5_9ACTN|nr:diaminohydroxyphosphoribosylaminopyrimidine deaminase [Kribbella sp. VKM Ac-2500]TCO10254.1 diaminohydroxyphosphoribosylaminopyrimidine deaminase [Kribbella orskensis]
MRRAVALSALGLGSASPNPPVGCLVLDVDGNVVGEGYHRRKGEAHAEVNALAAAGERARGGTAVVTLEPCNHQGRTPPCRQALIDAGIARVVIALIDPTSREEGGAARLKAAGVDVELDVLSDEARLVIGPWLEAFASGLPHVHWAYVVESDARPVLDPVADGVISRTEFDAIQTSDGRIEEGVPGAHSPDEFSLPPMVGAEPAAILADLFSRGVRSLLISGRTKLAAAMADSGLVNRITLCVPRQPSSSRPAAMAGQALGVPAGYEVHAVAAAGPYVRLDLVRIDRDAFSATPADQTAG